MEAYLGIKSEGQGRREVSRSRVFFIGNARYCFFRQGDNGLMPGIIQEAEESYHGRVKQTGSETSTPLP